MMPPPMRLLLLLFLLSSGCAGLECGVGTHEEQGQCVPNVPVACGPGTVFELGYCVPERAPDCGDAGCGDATGDPPDTVGLELPGASR